MVRTSGCQCQNRNSPKNNIESSDTVADEAVLSIVHKIIDDKMAVKTFDFSVAYNN